MKVQAQYGPQRSRRFQVVATVAAGMVTIMLVAQLFAYEDVPAILSSLLPFNDYAFATLLAGIVVVVELLALPYLLGMYLSKLMRLLSGCCALLVALFWLFLLLTNSHAGNSGLFSTVFELPGGIVAVGWAALLCAGVVAVIVHDSQIRHQRSSVENSGPLQH